nr:DUF2076 family protein [uncultured Noviherbaspirillum sp.]
MTPQEQEKLQQFLTQLQQAQGVQRDPEADAVISAAVSRQPDAAYLLVQRTLLQDQALEAARVRIAELERQAQGQGQGQAAPSAGSFLGGADAWGNSARTRPAVNTPAMDTPAASAYPQSPAYQGGSQAQQSPQRQGALSRFGMGGGGGGGSFLGTMAATAAGVAGGAFLFQGLGSLLGGNQGADAAKQGLASDTGANATPAADNSLAQEAGAGDVGNTPAQEQGAMDDTASLDDFGSGDDFGGGDDSVI